MQIVVNFPFHILGVNFQDFPKSFVDLFSKQWLQNKTRCPFNSVDLLSYFQVTWQIGAGMFFKQKLTFHLEYALVSSSAIRHSISFGGEHVGVKYHRKLFNCLTKKRVLGNKKNEHSTYPGNHEN